MREIRTRRLTRRGLETEPWDGLRHRQRAKAAGKQRLPISNVTAPVFDPTGEGETPHLKGSTLPTLRIYPQGAGTRPTRSARVQYAATTPMPVHFSTAECHALL